MLNYRKNKKKIAFHRQYNQYSGGHQKVRDYLDHCMAYGQLDVSLWCESSSKVNANLFSDIPGITYQQSYAPQDADIVFLAGMDWKNYLPFYDEKQTKVNLIQHVRHGDKRHPLFQFLQFKAVRLCVSQAVYDAIIPYANGPCYVIKMGHEIPNIKLHRDIDVYVLATKQPSLGKQITTVLQQRGYHVVIHDEPTERSMVYQAMAAAKVTLALPNKTEGFYLPGIEAMQLSGWAVIPDCIASREYSSPGANITMCELSADSCLHAIEAATSAMQTWTYFLHKRAGVKRAREYKPQVERQTLYRVLDSL
ncbi:MAG: hypothetical protein GW763_14015 [Paraglaciecola sp.]|nr:hypothetical protein [Paraglaciecola sp.]NCT49070.1 hypothetical protein [Paraglaciecola sp.]